MRARARPSTAIAIAPSLVARPSRLPAFARPRSRSSSTARSRVAAGVRERLLAVHHARAGAARGAPSPPAAEISATLYSCCSTAPAWPLGPRSVTPRRAVAGARAGAGEPALAAGGSPPPLIVQCARRARAAPAPRRLLDLDHDAGPCRPARRALAAARAALLGRLALHALVEELRALDAGVGDQRGSRAGSRGSSRRCRAPRSRCRSGLQFESTIATIGMPRRCASVTAMCSRPTSITKSASGSRVISRMPSSDLRYFSTERVMREQLLLGELGGLLLVARGSRAAP